jgi:Family of unknown function (DUF6194)
MLPCYNIVVRDLRRRVSPGPLNRGSYLSELSNIASELYDLFVDRISPAHKERRATSNMNAASIVEYITSTFDEVDVVEDSGNYFLFTDPQKKFTFVTVVTNDAYDSFSDLNRDGVFRVNIGIGKETFLSMFPKQKKGEENSDRYDFTALDQLMPHPVYGMMYWVCILNPSNDKFRTDIAPLIAEAYKLSEERYGKRASRV